MAAGFDGFDSSRGMAQTGSRTGAVGAGCGEGGWGALDRGETAMGGRGNAGGGRCSLVLGLA